MAQEVSRRSFLGTAGAATALGTTATVALAADAAGDADRPKIKIVGISCSPRKGMNTHAAVQAALEAAAAVGENVETELIDLAGKSIPGQVAAGEPLEPGQRDDFPAIGEKLSQPNLAGLIIGTPVYFGNMSYLCKSLLDRCIALRKAFTLAGKVGGVVAVGGGRNGGQELTIRSVHNCLMGQAMVIVGDAPPTGHWGGTACSGFPEGVTADEVGMKTVKNLGRNVAETALRLAKS